jgi:hypothetical protein
MPASKPLTFPRWANVGGSIVVPPGGKQDIGWIGGEKPAAEYLNWYQKLNYDWVLYLSDFEQIARTWSAIQTHSVDIVLSGSADLKHATRYRAVNLSDFFGVSGTTSVDDTKLTMGVGATVARLKLPVNPGERVLGVRAWFAVTGVNNSASLALYSNSGGPGTVIDSVLPSGFGFNLTAGANYSQKTMTLATPQPYTGTGPDDILIQIETFVAGSTTLVRTLEMIYDRV